MAKRRAVAGTRPGLRVRTAAKSGRAAVSSVPAEKNSRADAPLASNSRWTFLTNHAHVLILLAQNSSMVLREVARQVGITERAVHRILADLEESGYVLRVRNGRQNQYELSTKLPLRHPIEGHCTIGDLITMVSESR